MHILRKVFEVDLLAVGLGALGLWCTAAGCQLGLGHGNNPGVTWAEEGHGLEGALVVFPGQQGLTVAVLDATAKAKGDGKTVLKSG